MPVAPATPVPQLGNVPVAPVYSSPSLNPFASPTLVGPPVAATPGTPVPVGPPLAAPIQPAAAVAVRTERQDYLRISPARVLAPVGSEVVLRAGHCSRNGYLLANQRVEWILSREGAGEFVDLNDRGVVDVFRWPWNTPRKVDNWYAIGATAVARTNLGRATASPTDDLEIQRGEAWITVTSPTEGTSHVTAYSPVIDDRQCRRVTATIYWIDAQWLFPPSTTVALGQSHTLTTTVTRRSDGAPLAGYAVRYEVIGEGAANLGYDEGPVTDVPTDAQGRASVEVSPTSSTGGTATINVTVIRPPQAGSAAGPELALGRGTVTLNWAAGGVVTPPPALEPALTTPGQSPPITPPITTTPPPSTPPDTFAPPVDEPPPGRPQLDVSVRTLTAEQVEVGQFAQFEIRVTNTGDGIARNVVVRDEFDDGLRVPGYESTAVESQIRDLAPGDSELQNISFEVLRDGQLCHRVTASDGSGSRDFERACVTGVAPPPVVMPTLAVDVRGPTQQIVGELGIFEIVVRNTGTVPAENITLINTYPAEFRAVQVSDPNHEHLPDRRLIWQIDRLDVGQSLSYRVQYEFLNSARSTCVLAEAEIASGGVYVDEQCTEILPAEQGAAPGGAPPTNPAIPGGGPGGLPQAGPGRQPPQTLQLSVASRANPARAGERTSIQVEIANTGTEPQSEVSLRVAFPEELAPDPVFPSQIRYRLEDNGREVRFEPIGTVRAGERISINIPVSVRRAGSVTVWGRLESPNLAAPIDAPSESIDILPQSL